MVTMSLGASEKDAQWIWFDSHTWQSYDVETNAQIERAFLKGVESVNLDVGHFGHCPNIHRVFFHYNTSPPSFHQINVLTKDFIHVKRTLVVRPPGYKNTPSSLLIGPTSYTMPPKKRMDASKSRSADFQRYHNHNNYTPFPSNNNNHSYSSLSSSSASASTSTSTSTSRSAAFLSGSGHGLRLPGFVGMLGTSILSKNESDPPPLPLPFTLPLNRESGDDRPLLSAIQRIQTYKRLYQAGHSKVAIDKAIKVFNTKYRVNSPILDDVAEITQQLEDLILMDKLNVKLSEDGNSAEEQGSHSSNQSKDIVVNDPNVLCYSGGSDDTVEETKEKEGISVERDRTPTREQSLTPVSVRSVRSVHQVETSRESQSPREHGPDHVDPVNFGNDSNVKSPRPEFDFKLGAWIEVNVDGTWIPGKIIEINWNDTARIIVAYQDIFSRRSIESKKLILEGPDINRSRCRPLPERPSPPQHPVDYSPNHEAPHRSNCGFGPRSGRRSPNDRGSGRFGFDDMVNGRDHRDHAQNDWHSRTPSPRNEIRNGFSRGSAYDGAPGLNGKRNENNGIQNGHHQQQHSRFNGHSNNGHRTPPSGNGGRRTPPHTRRLSGGGGGGGRFNRSNLSIHKFNFEYHKNNKKYDEKNAKHPSEYINRKCFKCKGSGKCEQHSNGSSRFSHRLSSEVVPCPRCKSTGYAIASCTKCINGSGVFRKSHSLAHSKCKGMGCARCNGTGKYPLHDIECNNCKGSGVYKIKCTQCPNANIIQSLGYIQQREQQRYNSCISGFRLPQLIAFVPKRDDPKLAVHGAGDDVEGMYNMRRLFHATDREGADNIVETGTMARAKRSKGRKGSTDACYEAGIQFTDSGRAVEAAARRKGFLVIADVFTGRVKDEHHKDPSLNFQVLHDLGYDSVRGHWRGDDNGTEFVVYHWDQVWCHVVLPVEQVNFNNLR